MPEVAEAFGEGCEARLAGVPLSANPHPCTRPTNQDYFYWRLGWLDVEHHWGEAAKWPVKKLPEVKE